MRKLIILVAVACALTALADAYRPVFQRLYNEHAKALAAKDWKAMSGLLASDFQFKEMGAKAKDGKAYWKEFAKVRSIKEENRILKLSQNGNTVTIDVSRRVALLYADGKWERSASRSAPWRDEWVSTAKGWKLRRQTQVGPGMIGDGVRIKR